MHIGDILHDLSEKHFGVVSLLLPLLRINLLYNTGNQSLLHFTLLQRKTHMSGAWSQKQAHIKRKTTLINCSYIDIMGYWNNLCCDLSP